MKLVKGWREGRKRVKGERNDQHQLSNRGVNKDIADRPRSDIICSDLCPQRSPFISATNRDQKHAKVSKERL